jgi:uncharacterized membrane protein
MAKATQFLHQHGASKRLELLSDGVFAIAATLLVLEIRVPELEHGMGKTELLKSLIKIIPSMVAFIFSFMNIMVFWMNHDSISMVTRYFDRKITFLNIIFLLFISLVPFTSRLISEYPDSFIAISIYGIVLMLCSIIATIMYRHIAFKTDMMMKEVSMKSRKKVWKRIVFSPFIYLFAIIAGWFHVYIPIFIYILMPVVFIFLPDMDLNEMSDKENNAQT